MSENNIESFERSRAKHVIPRGGKLVLREHTRYQELEIRDLPDLGRCLFLDGRLQSSERYEHLYHEYLVHPAMVLHPQPRRVFIAGGGEGATLREVLRHQTLQRVTMVEIDEAVVRASQTYLQKWHKGTFLDSRLELIFADARAYLHQTEQKWDCIIVDVTSPTRGGVSWPLFTQEFYQLAQTRLTKCGVFVQAIGMGKTVSFVSAVLRTLNTVFRFVVPYGVELHDPTGLWYFALASNHGHPREMTQEAVEAILKERSCFNLRAYTGRAHEAMFCSHSFRIIKLPEGHIITDACPLFVS